MIGMKLNKIFKNLLNLIILIIGGLIFSYLQTTFGWTNPINNPPSQPSPVSIKNGNVGIGAPNPSQTLHVGGAIRITNLLNCDTIDSDSSGNLFCGTDQGAGLGGSGTTNYLAKFTNPTTVGNSVIFENSGNIGIGTTNPSAKLDVNGDIYLSGNLANECSLSTYVGKTSTGFDGNQGGYAGADSKCNAAFSGSHVCSADEIIRGNRCGPPYPSSNLWHNSYNSAKGADLIDGAALTTNDCLGWTSSSATNGGNIIWGGNYKCSRAVDFACCK